MRLRLRAEYPSRLKLMLAVGGAACAIAIGGCGSASTAPGSTASTHPSSSPTATAPATPTPASIDSFVAQANAICTNAASQGDAVTAPTLSGGTISAPEAADLPAIGSYFQSLVTLFQQLTASLQGLGTPPSMQSLWAQALATFGNVVTDFSAAATNAQAGNLSGYESALAQEETDNMQVDQDFDQFGATACAAGGASSSPSPSASPSVSPSPTPTPT
jgi:hypothetical protein